MMDWKTFAGGIVLLVGALGAVWTAANVIGRLDYVQKSVTPEAMLEFRVEEARRLQREEIRFCVLAEVSSPDPKMRNIFRCLE